MIFLPSGNEWNNSLLDRFPALTAQLPTPPPSGNRRFRIGQFWSTAALRGPEGHIIEIMGLHSELVVGRTWVNLTVPGQWMQETPLNDTWYTPLLRGSSRGAGATEHFPIDFFLQDEAYHHHFSMEVTVRQRRQTTFIKRKLTHTSRERSPTILPLQLSLISPSENLNKWESWISSVSTTFGYTRTIP